jgi:uncharacterized protein YycO
VGGLRRLSATLLGNVITHALLFIGHRAFVNAVADGVELESLHAIFTEYDTMIILRLKDRDKKKLAKATAFAEKQIGKPYDFEFEPDQEKFYCSELIVESLLHADIYCGLQNKKDRRTVIWPTDFINESFKIIFHSHNIVVKKQ